MTTEATRTAERTEEPSTKEPLQDKVRRNMQPLSMVGVGLAVAVFFTLVTDAFLTGPNLSNLGRQMAPTLVVAVAMTFVITSGQIDLSVGSTVALVSALSAILLENGLDSALVILIGLAAGAGIGAVNGWFSASS